MLVDVQREVVKITILFGSQPIGSRDVLYALMPTTGG